MPAVHAGNQVRSWFRNPQNQTDRSEIKIDLSGALTICQKTCSCLRQIQDKKQNY